MNTTHASLAAVLILFAAFSSCLNAQTSLTNGLVAYYPFHGNALDASGNGFNPNANTATLCADRFGIPNQAYFFNGTQSYIQFNAPILTQVSNWTLTAWVQPADLNPVAAIVDMGDGYDGYGMYIQNGQFFGLLGGINGYGSGSDFPTNNQWYNIVMVNNAGITTFYLNNVLAANSISQTPLTPTGAFTIGALVGQWYFHGAIDEVRVYNRPLSPNEISELFNYSNSDIIITNQPTSVSTNQNSAVAFSVGVYSYIGLSLSFQWQFNGTNIAGATNSVLNLSAVQFADAGVYDVVVSNGSNSVTSSNATLAVVNPGAPNIYVNSNLVIGTASVISRANITMTPGFTNGFILYSLSEDDSGLSGLLDYTGPFTVTNSVYIIAYCYSSDLSQYAEMQPLDLQIVPLYSLTTSVVGGGTISLNPNTNSFASNAVVTLTATAAPNWAFSNWLGVLTNSNPLTVTVTSNRNIQAVFTPTAFSLSLTTAGGGMVLASGQTSDGINFATNSIVTLTASSNTGWVFLGWQGAVNSASNPASLLMSQSSSVQASFGSFAVTNAVGGGQILLNTTNPTPYGNAVTAAAIANNGNYFALWAGAATGTNSPVNAIITNANAAIDALFLPLPFNKLSLSVGVLGNGSVNIIPQQSYYSFGDSVTLTAIPNSPAVTFYGWMGGDNYTNQTTTVILNTNLIVYANFIGVPSPSTASATAIISAGSCSLVVMGSGGFGYTNTPAVTIIGGGGVGATATAVLQNGIVVAVNIVNAGTGYTNAPQIIIEPPIVQQPQVNIALVSYLTFSNLTVSANYLLQQYVSQTWENLPQGITATNTTMSQWVNGIANGSNYRVVATPLPTTATAVAITNYGFVVSAVLTGGGSGYTSPPAVTILGGGGSGATAAATVTNGQVSGITILSAGSGYSSIPTITIAAPPLAGGYAYVKPGVLLGMDNLMINQIYQLQYASQPLNNSWTSLDNDYILAVNTNLSQFIFITNSGAYYRLQYVP